MHTLLTMQCTHYLQCSAHTTYNAVHTLLTMQCTHYLQCSAHTTYNAVHTLLTMQCTHYLQCSAHTTYNAVHTLLTMQCTHYLQCSAHTTYNAVHTLLTMQCIHYLQCSAYSTDKNHMHIGRVFPEVERVKCTRFALAAPSRRTNESRGDNARSTREYAFFRERGFVLLIVLIRVIVVFIVRVYPRDF